MSNLLKTGAEWLEGRRRAHMTSAVTYSRGANSVSVQATIGRTRFDVQRESGVHVKEETRDYIISVQDLVLAGQSVEPQAGDRIVEDAASSLVYEVMPAEGTEQAWRFSDEFRIAYRIHAKLVAVS